MIEAEPAATVIVFGASGFIGTRLVRWLTEATDVAKICAIDIVQPRECLPGVEYLMADVRDPIPLALGEGVSRVYNLAAVHRTPGHPDSEYYDTNIGGAINITRFAEESNIREIIFTSSISVYGPSEEVLSEKSPLRPVSAYGHSKKFAEDIHAAWVSRERERRLVVVRPGVVFGPGERGNYSLLAKALRTGRFAYPGRMDTIKSGGYVDELLKAIEFARSVNVSRVLFNFAYPNDSTIYDIVALIDQIGGTKGIRPVLPLPLLLAAAGGFELLNSLGIKNKVHRQRVLKLVQSTRISPQWLKEANYQFSTDLPAALKMWFSESKFI
jgi:nucleoside-diphosphate-sugar epimerase